MRVAVIAAQQEAAFALLGGARADAVWIQPCGDDRADYATALESGADYVLKLAEPAAAEPADIQAAFDYAARADRPFVIGSACHQGVGGKISAFLMRLVYTYSFTILLKCGAPVYLLLRGDMLRTLLEDVPQDFPSADAALVAAAHYAKADVEIVPCTNMAHRAAQTVCGRVFGHVFHSLKVFKRLDLSLRAKYGKYQMADKQRRQMHVLDKLLSLAHREMVTYLIYGVLTTVVNYVVFWVCGKALGTDKLLGDKNYLISNGVSWVAAVAFAYVTNKLFVFDSKSWAPRVLLKEIPSFVGARALSLVFDMGIMFMCVTLIGMHEMIAKLLSQVVVVILNYFFSKLFIFRGKHKGTRDGKKA